MESADNFYVEQEMLEHELVEWSALSDMRSDIEAAAQRAAVDHASAESDPPVSAIESRLHPGSQGNVKYKCDVCSLPYTSKGSLTRHKLIHLGESFKCYHCEKIFKTNYLLMRHAARCSSMFINVHQCTSMFINVHQCSSMFINSMFISVHQCSSMFINVHQCSLMFINEMFINVHQCSSMFIDVHQCASMFINSTFINVHRCSSMFINVHQCSSMQCVHQCSSMFINVHHVILNLCPSGVSKVK